MTDTVRIEARNAESDEDYVNAIEVPAESAHEIVSEWSGRYGHVSTVGDESDEAPETDEIPEPEPEPVFPDNPDNE